MGNSGVDRPLDWLTSLDMFKLTVGTKDLDLDTRRQALSEWSHRRSDLPRARRVNIRTEY